MSNRLSLSLVDSKGEGEANRKLSPSEFESHTGLGRGDERDLRKKSNFSGMITSENFDFKDATSCASKSQARAVTEAASGSEISKENQRTTRFQMKFARWESGRFERTQIFNWDVLRIRIVS
jgi:hypothetical protein